MSAGEGAPAPDRLLRVAKGRPTPTEIAAVAAVVLAASRQVSCGAGPHGPAVHRGRPVRDGAGRFRDARSWESWEVP